MSFQSRDTKSILLIKRISVGFAALAFLVIVAAIALYFAIRASVPKLEGNTTVPSLSQLVLVGRDANGTVKLGALNELDAMRALGYVHAQERFFEMDLTRRSAAGELSELLGKVTLDRDKEKRLYRFRARLTADFPNLPESQRTLLKTYTEGVNAGLTDLPVRPWQYLALRTQPQPWTEVDSLLVVAEMYSMLQLRSIDGQFGDSLLREQLSAPIFQWLKPRGGTWDGALDGSVMPPIPMPTAEEWSIAREKATPSAPVQTVMHFPHAQNANENDSMIGSNAWAISGALTAPSSTGGAMLSNDMHLGLQVPNIWFRAEIMLLASGNTPDKRRVAGVTLPGIPGVVVGSNGNIAWGFTNSYGQWFEWVPAKGMETNIVNETINVKGGEPVTFAVRETTIGPIAKKHDGHDYALAWTALKPGAIDIKLSELAGAEDVTTALDITNRAGMPHQNLFVADKRGNIGWTIAGKMPQRRGVSMTSPRPGFTRPDEATLPRLDPARVPRITNPANHRLWSGNNRQLGGDGGALIGDGGFDMGARGQQIRDRLLERTQFNEQQLINIQYDNEARFMKRWADLANLAKLPVDIGSSDKNTGNKTDKSNAGDAEMMSALKTWQTQNGKADTDQVGYRIVRAFRYRVIDELWKSWIADIAPATAKHAAWDGRFEYAVWQAVTERPAYLLPKSFKSWDDFLAAQAEWVKNDLITQHGNIKDATWGARNKAAIKHPFSRILPALSPYLDMPATPQSGDSNMPAVAAPTFGASQRLSVTPGKEENGILTMPGGQSGHPLSPFYGAGHKQWATQKSMPLLAGEAQYTLLLRPQ
jgi:penicillin G amidase